MVSAHWKLRQAVLLAPLVSLGVIGLAAVVSGLLGVRWGIGPVAVATAVAAAVLFVITLRVRRPSEKRKDGRHSRPTRVFSRRVGRRYFVASARRSMPTELSIIAQYLVGAVAASTIFAYPFTRALQGPDYIAQRFDNAFHLNAIEYISQTGDASPFALGRLVGSSVYPSGWHQLNALIGMVGGLPVPAVVQACTLVVVFAVWPLSVAALVEVVLRPRPVVRLITPALSLGFMAFPWLLLSWGLLYPNILGFAVTPAMVALVVGATGRTYRSPAALMIALAVVALGAVGSAGAHPSAFLTAALVACPFLVVRLARVARWRRGRSAVVWVQTLIELGAVIAVPVTWVVLAPPTNVAPWTAYESIPQALGEAVLGGSRGLPVVWTQAVLVVAGLMALAMARRYRWMLVSTGLAGAIFVVCVGAQSGILRDVLAGPFYRDNYRAAAAFVTVLPVVSVAGFELLVDAVLRVARKSVGGGQRVRFVDPDSSEDLMRLKSPSNRLPSSGARRALRAATMVIGLVTAVALSQATVSSASFAAAMEEVRHAFLLDPTSDIVSTDEMALISRLDTEVPPSAVIVVDPWRGGGLAYALAQRNVTELYMFSPDAENDPDIAVIRASLKDASDDPDVCAALDGEGAGYYLQMDPHGIGEVDTDSQYPGYVGIDEHTSGFQLIDRSGEASLYRITACS